MLKKQFQYAAYFFCIGVFSCAFAKTANQTASLTPVVQNGFLPFQVQIEQASFMLPNGLHSYVTATYEGKWIFLAGRTNGMHDFSDTTNNFPPRAQNSVIYVVDPIAQTVAQRSLYDPASGLTQHQIDLLSVTSAQSCQSGDQMYITGGYGVDSATGEFSTKNVFTSINMPCLINWVNGLSYPAKLVSCIRQISHPIFQIAGGYMASMGDGSILLVFGQNFTGYYFDSSNGTYSEQVRRFYVHDDGTDLFIEIVGSKPLVPDPNYRRRDLNVVPIIEYKDAAYEQKLVAYAGVFTEETGVWTVPVTISENGKTSMRNPYKASTFKQAMNQYVCPTLPLFSAKSRDMFTVFFGGISYGFFKKGIFKTDAEIPFINQVTTIKIDRHRVYSQYLMEGEYPVILSKNSHAGHPLLFGAGAQFIVAEGISTYGNGVVDLDALPAMPTLIGYIVGGIQSTVHNTRVPSDSAASPFIFTVTLNKN